MGNSRLPSPTTDSSKTSATSHKLANLSLMKGLLPVFSGLPAAALAGVVVMFVAWSCEHQARQREVTEAKQAKKQAAEEISQLQQQAAGALRDAQQSTQAVQALEGQRQQLAREAERLRQSLDSLRQQEFTRANEVATLPTSEVASRVASRLQEQGSDVKGQGSGQGSINPLTPRNPGGEGQNNSGGEGAKSAAALVLSDQGVRKVETAFLDLDSCRQQNQVIGQQVSNCAQQAKLDAALQEQQSGTISKLNAALADKDKILAQSEEEHRAELKAARGTWRSRFLHAVEIFAGGFVAGVLVR